MDCESDRFVMLLLFSSRVTACFVYPSSQLLLLLLLRLITDAVEYFTVVLEGVVLEVYDKWLSYLLDCIVSH